MKALIHKEIVMLYRLENDKGRRIQRTAHELGMIPKMLTEQDAGQCVGYCAGLPGYQRLDCCAGQTGGEEALIFSGLTRSRLNQFLDALRKADVSQVALKAMVTPTNAEWTVDALLEELSKEHEMMGAMQSLWAQVKAVELLDQTTASENQRQELESALETARVLTAQPPQSLEPLLLAKEALVQAAKGLPVRQEGDKP